MSTSQSWTIVVFGYNEAGTVVQVIDKVRQVLEEMDPIWWEIVVVDDGSRDGTTELVAEQARLHREIRPVFHPVNQGIGPALRAGYRESRGDNICAVPADGQFDVREILPYAQLPEKSFVSFYRPINLHCNHPRRLLTLANKLVNRFLIGVEFKDVNWVKIYPRQELQSLQLELKSSLVESEICAKLVVGGNKLVEVESKFLDRTWGRSKGASFPIARQAASEIWKLHRAISRYRRQVNRKGN